MRWGRKREKAARGQTARDAVQAVTATLRVDDAPSLLIRVVKAVELTEGWHADQRRQAEAAGGAGEGGSTTDP